MWEPNRVVGSYAVPRSDVLTSLHDDGAVLAPEVLPPVLTPRDAFDRRSCAGTGWTIDAPSAALSEAGFTPQTQIWRST